MGYMNRFSNINLPFHFCFELYLVIDYSLRVDGSDFPGSRVVTSLPANAGDTGLNPGRGGSHVPRSN